MKPNKRRRAWLILLIVLALLLLLTQLQPTLLQLSGAVDGSFGLRPTSHKCAGFTLNGDWVAARLSPADWQGKFGRFSLRWFVPEEAGGRDFCLGQDVWFGE
ncbi:MAG: hypothetical protein AB1750_19230 [Chloroflexota bacterium]